ncbi:MAG: hypothetical protein IPG63_08255 [Xanthomonadales bacterium]|nr:hypothetical protein [Xanthomonadales bacterium]
MKRMQRVVWLMVLCVCPVWVAAANYCVDTAAELESALVSAALSSGDDAIQVVQGEYTFGGDIDYAPIAMGGALSITGGYLGDCSDGVRSTRAQDTSFSASVGTSFRIQKLSGERLSQFANIDFWGFDEVRFAVGSCASGGATLKLSNVRVGLGGSASSDALSLHNLCGDTRGYNVLVHDAVGDGVSAVSDAASEEIDFVNLTSVDNGGRGLKVIRLGEGSTRLWNAIVHGNGTDLYGNGGNFVVEHSIFASSGGAATVSGSNNLAVDPQLDSNFHPVAALSPAIDSGTHDVAITLATSDLGGGPRIVGLKVDRGAMEFGASPDSILTVLNANDSGIGSLRDALLDAQAAPGRQFIHFAIPGACPRVITLASLLPELTDLVSIDGYTQPGSRANDSAFGFNASLCVIITAGAPTLPYGLRVATTGYGGSEVKGLAFSGFLGSDGNAAAIQLVSGADHRVYGNQFGGHVAGLGLVGSRNGIRVGASANRIEIGGDLAARNLIGGSSEVGVLIASAEGRVALRGNLIGTGSSGNSVLANGTGVLIDDSGFNHVAGNKISGNLGHGLMIRGGDSDENVVEENSIGVKAFSFCLPPCTPNPALPNGGDGIHVTRAAGDAENHVPTYNRFIRNEVAFNGGAGFGLVDGWGTIWRENTVHDNDDLAVDIGNDGVDPIDDDTSQEFTLAQGGMNRPRILAVDGESIDIEFSGMPGGYEVTVYVNEACDPSGFGEGERVFVMKPTGIGGEGMQTIQSQILRPTSDDWSQLQGKYLTTIASHVSYALPGFPFGYPARGFGEFSECFPVTLIDSLFVDGFE